MPPKKRKATAVKAQPAKKVRIGESSNIDNAATSAPEGRPKRTSVGAPDYSDKKRHVPKAEEVQQPEPIPQSEDAAPRKRGRPRKVQPPRSPRKATPAKGILKAKSEPTPTPPVKRGRPPKKTTKQTVTAPDLEAAGEVLSAAAPRARATAAKLVAAKKAATKVPAKRGRPRKVIANDTKNTVSQPARSSPDVLNVTEEDSEEDTGSVTSKETLDQLDEETQYWLMKAEPNTRMEKGQDVKFSIDDLMSKAEPEAWDGVYLMTWRSCMMLISHRCAKCCCPKQYARHAKRRPRLLLSLQLPCTRHCRCHPCRAGTLH